jgi:hypothetical protein
LPLADPADADRLGGSGAYHQLRGKHLELIGRRVVDLCSVGECPPRRDAELHSNGVRPGIADREHNGRRRGDGIDNRRHRHKLKRRGAGNHNNGENDHQEKRMWAKYRGTHTLIIQKRPGKVLLK